MGLIKRVLDLLKPSEENPVVRIPGSGFVARVIYIRDKKVAKNTPGQLSMCMFDDKGKLQRYEIQEKFYFLHEQDYLDLQHKNGEYWNREAKEIFIQSVRDAEKLSEADLSKYGWSIRDIDFLPHSDLFRIKTE